MVLKQGYPLLWSAKLIRFLPIVMGLTILPFVLVSMLVPQQSMAVGPTVWVTSGMERVGKTDLPGSATRATIYAARGEYEPFQIAIRASRMDLTNVNVTVSDLLGTNKYIIPSTSMMLYREHYVYVKYASPDRGGANRPLGPGWYPDALIPFSLPNSYQTPISPTLRAAPFDLMGGFNQPIWVDVFVPREAPAGQYTGTFTVTSDQGTVNGEIALTVWNFTLPLKPSLNSFFEYWTSGTTEANVELLKQKLMPKQVAVNDEQTLIDQEGLGATNLNYWSGANINTCRMEKPPSVAQLQASVARHQPDILLYNHTADEIDNCPNLYEPLKAWARNLHTAGVSNLVTMTPVPELYDDGSGTGRAAVDIWGLLPKMYDAAPQQVQEVLKRGYAVWSYNALVQDDYSPKWQIDFAPINYRIQAGFINQSLGITGLLYWRVDLWTNDPWQDVQTFTLGGENYPGEGMLVYPGKPVGVLGVVPSMRLKWIREGVEDYEYIQILKQRGYEAEALDIARSVGADWKNWTKDPAQLAAARQQLGEAINRSSPVYSAYLPLTSTSTLMCANKTYITPRQ